MAPSLYTGFRPRAIRMMGDLIELGQTRSPLRLVVRAVIDVQY